MTDGEAIEERIAQLSAEAQSCRSCRLSETRTKVVFGEGNPVTPMMIIGEGPGQTEDETGRPFVGRAGQLLDACLKENGITRKHIYICNTVRCRACNVEGSRVSNRPPTLEEIAACSHWLEATVEAIQPLVILCLGASSANTLIHPEFRMTAERGRWFTGKLAPYVMATWHPAYILRQEGQAFDSSRRALVADIGAAREKIKELRRAEKSARPVETNNE